MTDDEIKIQKQISDFLDKLNGTLNNHVVLFVARDVQVMQSLTLSHNL